VIWIISFAGALPSIREPFSLITTDGDAAVPSDMTASTVEALLGNPWLVSWHTQNYDGYTHPKLFPFPIGLDLHTPRFLQQSEPAFSAAAADSGLSYAA